MVDLLLQTRGLGSVYLDLEHQRYYSLWVSKQQLAVLSVEGDVSVESGQSEWLLERQEFIQAQSVRQAEIGEAMIKHWMCEEKKQADYMFYLEY